MVSEANAPDPTEKPPERRKLIAVMYTDMVGYSRLIGLDDAGTLDRLRTLRRNLIDPAIDEHGRRIVQTGGDSLLIVFDSIDGAVRCAVEVQQQVPTHDGDQPPDRAIRFRVGINIGDAIADGTDLHGEAVNVAARIQAECPPGGICVTRAVRDHMRGRPDLTFEELGTLNLKNIARPVEAFVLRPASAVSTSEIAEQSLVYRTEALSLPDRPTIAVLPFANMSGDLEQEYLSDGIANDIIAELSRSRALFVIARNSSFAYRGRAVDVKRVAQELGVRYLVEGSVRRSASRIRVTAQLIDAETGNHMWVERYDRELADVFEIQDEIAESVATAIGRTVGDAEQWRALRKFTGSMGAWDNYQRGLWHMLKGNPADNRKAQELFRRARQADIGFAPAYSGLALTILRDGLYYGTRPIKDAARLAEVEARKAVSIDPNDSDALAALGAAFAIGGHVREAMGYGERALTLNRNCALAHWVKGSMLRVLGRHSECRDEALASLRLNPRDPISPINASLLSMSYYLEGKYADAVESSQRCLADYPTYAPPRRFLVAALGQLGHREEAAAELQEFLAVAPDVFEAMVRNRPPYMRPDDQAHLLDGFRKAGWQG
jgi:adenylate cyclase